MTRFINCTGHDIGFAVDDKIYNIPKTNVVVKVETEEEAVGEEKIKIENDIVKVGFKKRRFKQQIINYDKIPEKEGVIYIVSALVLGQVPENRHDIVAPDTGPTSVRENGRVVAVRNFIRR